MTTDPNDERIKAMEVRMLLCDAQPTNDKLDRNPRGTKEWRIEELRIGAVRDLRALYQSPPVDDRVRIFFDEKWECILRASDPAAAAAEFFNGKPRRGRKPVSEESLLRIARAVQEHIDDGKTVEEACKMARSRHAPEIGSWERIREIYYGSATDKEAKKNWQLAVGARRLTAAEVLLMIEPILRAVSAATGRNPELWLDFLINGGDLI